MTTLEECFFMDKGFKKSLRVARTFVRNWLKCRSRLKLWARKENKNLYEENTQLKHQVDQLTHMMRFKKEAAEAKDQFLTTINQRHRAMTTEAIGMNILVEAVASSELPFEAGYPEIQELSRTASAMLRDVQKGFLGQCAPQKVNLLDLLTQCQRFFARDIAEHNLSVALNVDADLTVMVDEDILLLIVYNIFHIIFLRFMENRKLQVRVTQQDYIVLRFMDNSYDLEDRLQKLRNDSPHMHRLVLAKENLLEYATDLGWKLSFEKENDHNVIELHILEDQSQPDDLPGNVVNLFNR